MKKDMPIPTEYQEQCRIFEWARLMVSTGQEPRLRLLRAGMEGVRLTIGTRVKAKRAGMDSSWPDLTLFVPKTATIYPDPRRHIVFHALLIELKRVKGGMVSPEQRAMHYLLMDQGYEVCVCRGADEAINTIKAYLGMEG